MKRTGLLDTGPLVSFLNRKARYHNWAVENLAEFQPPLYSCEAVLSEACFLLRSQPGGAEAVLDLVERGLIVPDFDLRAEASAVKRFLSRYANVPMALADACLVRLSELHSSAVLLTLDSDFDIYRRNQRSVIPTVMPDDLRLRKRRK